MKITELTVRNFRNIEHCVLCPSPGLNQLIGLNGQGKTSILEAIGYLATLRSFRGSKGLEVLKWGESTTEIAASLRSQVEARLKICLDSGKKRAFINEKPYASSTRYLQQRFGEWELGFHAVVFNPSDHELVRGEPHGRRSYLDRVLAAEGVDYLHLLQKYQRILLQRNQLLKNPSTPHSKELLQNFTASLAQFAAKLTRTRLEWVERLKKPLKEISDEIAQEQLDLSWVYLSDWIPDYTLKNLDLIKNFNRLNDEHFAGQGPLPSLELLEQSFWKQASLLEANEWRVGHTLVGPHRDDWAFLMRGKVLRGHGSQGEVRASLLALKLAEMELFHEKTAHQPVFLLDDFSSELDRNRRAFLIQRLSRLDLQVFVTSTEEIGLSGKRFLVSEGRLQEVQKEVYDHARSIVQPS